MFEWIKKFFARPELPQPQDLGMTALPVDVSPTDYTQTVRHIGRLINLFNARNQTPEVKAEIRTRQTAIGLQGLKVPKTAAEAELLFRSVRG